MEQYVDFSELKGKVIKEVVVDQMSDDDSIKFICDNGIVYKMYHEQDCCESVHIESINGDILSFTGNTIVEAEENSNDNHDESDNDWDIDSTTWTFYRMADDKGNYAVIRWVGYSNGYYSEGVNFVKEQ